MKAIILAAGRGSRLEDVTDDKPKCLTILKDKPLIQWQLESLKKAGIKEIAIVRGYLKEKINFDNVTYFDNDEWESTNMVMTLVRASEWLKTEECLVFYSDIIYTSKTIKNLMSIEGPLVIPYNTNWKKLWEQRFEDPLVDAESFLIDDKYHVNEIGMKTNSYDNIQGQYMGIIKFTPEGFSWILEILDQLEDAIRRKIDFTSILSEILKNGKVILGMPSDELWLEIDNKKDLILAESEYSHILDSL